MKLLHAKWATGLVLLVLLAGLSNCRKNIKYDYRDGTPGDGEPVPSVTVDTNIRNIDVSKYAQARIFPGLVCTSEPRLMNQRLSMNLNYNFVGENLRISVPPQPQFSTGFYAAPGELIIIDAPTTNYSLSVQIGACRDNLSGIQNAPRDALIYSKTQLAPGRNYLRNLYGGPVYIYAGRPIATPVDIVFSNVVKMPDFVLNQTTDGAWRTAITNSCVPWLELRSQNMIFTVPRDYCVSRNISNPTALMKEWDDAINFDYYKWEGLAENPPPGPDTVDKAPLLPWRVVQDIKPSVGYGHSGFPVVTFNDYGWFDEFTDITQIRGGGCWGTFHEIGHNNQQGLYWSWSSLGETSNNLFVFKVAKRQSFVTPSAYPAKHPALASRIPQALAFALDAATKNFDGTDARINDPFSRLTPFLQIFDRVPANWGYPDQPHGWDFMAFLYKKARRAQRISLSDQDKRDFFYEAICDFTKRDWMPFFKAWGIQVSNVSAAKILALYPAMPTEIWKYNPLTGTGGTTPFDPYSRSNWTVTVNSFSTQEGSNGAISNALDGSLTTYWHSNYGTGTGPTTPPFVITCDMTRPLAVNGFRVSLRQSGTGTATGVKNIRIETSNDGNTWTQLTAFTPAADAQGNIIIQQVQGLQSYTLPATATFRYFRMTIPNTAANNNNATSSALSEIDVIKP